MSVKKFILLICSLMMSVYVSAAANPYWYYSFISSQYSPWLEQDFQSSNAWFECSELDKPLFCSDLVTIHATQVYATISFEHDTSATSTKSTSPTTLLLSSEFSLVNFNNLQLGLRQDGFKLKKLLIDGVTLDIEQEMKHQSVASVDREVLLLINRYSATKPRTLYWQSADKSRSAVWKSDLNGITITYTR
ncbi:hypothetical protein A9264_11695 [Vibrio sp. UCD-FRSSP16_10]|uniref:hypothetical protein n=1 Tax=unclassified Vibrio TaxID=2614977 RepID=UPI0007FC7660|nr:MULTISPECIES: hypothetical protein [unclassified Vibrio]OBT16296.1 hypothetical protein A9260_11905 [Vibrio sp. UCD-FRSSP16_30]OBT21161.1 hypothetical protein A9264_11695 [Vibrio sp. UCD-FRSSP16_10]